MMKVSSCSTSGFGDNSRVIDWILRRIEGEVEAVDGVTGRYPKKEDMNLQGWKLPTSNLMICSKLNRIVGLLKLI